MKTKTSRRTNSMNRSPLRRAIVLIPLVLACFALPPQARATCQDACLTNDNTVQGDDALINLTTGAQNTAIGFQALLNNSTGPSNTAIGASALLTNTDGDFKTAVGLKPCLTIQAVGSTRRLVIKRSFPTQPPSGTPPLVGDIICCERSRTFFCLSSCD